MTRKRFLEIIPGFTVWLVFIMPIFFSFFVPAVVAIFVIVFDLYWLFKAFFMGGHLIFGFNNMRKASKISWRAWCDSLSDPEKFMVINPSQRIKVSHALSHGALPSFESIYQVIILTTYKEEIETLRLSIESFLASDFPSDRILLLLATEERDKERARENAKVLKEEFADKFFDLKSGTGLRKKNESYFVKLAIYRDIIPNE